MTDAITTRISTDALKAASTTNDGVTVSRRTLTDQITAAKFVGANNALDQLVAGTHDFYRVRMNFPGAGGSSDVSDC